MRTVLLVSAFLAAFAAAAGCAAAAREGAERTAAATNLSITVWPAGRDGQSRSWTLRCSPARGTLPAPARACSRLSAMDAPFAPVPRDAVCTQVFGGPGAALVRGTYEGRKIWTRFDRRDGCRTSRWNRHAFLFPIDVGAAASR